MEIRPYTPLTQKYRPLVDQRIREVESSPYRPAYHIVPPCGLANDPNGLCYINGKYHVFYQWYPFEAKHDMKHWNHVISDDLITWEESDQILVPDLPYEKNGCYSGNAYVDSDNDQVYLYYTANYKDKDGVRIPQQALAVMDKEGKIKKSGDNPIIIGAPEHISGNIRDPFVFKFDNILYMLLGAETLDHEGALLLYTAQDPENWKYSGPVEITLDGEPLELGTMVECPGVIKVGDVDVMFLSFIGSKDNRYPHENRFDSVVLLGRFDPKERTFKATSLQLADHGFDFYAPQPFYDEKGLPLFYGWFGCANEELPEDKYHWRHALTLPREMIIEDGVFKTPISSKLNEKFDNIEISQSDPGLLISTKSPTHYHWRLSNDKDKHSLKIGAPDDFWEILVDLKSDEIILDRSHLEKEIDKDYGFIRKIPISQNDILDIDIFTDNSFNELYINNGEQVASFRSYEKTLDPSY